jgi:hypothetical protein
MEKRSLKRQFFVRISTSKNLKREPLFILSQIKLMEGLLLIYLKLKEF